MATWMANSISSTTNIEDQTNEKIIQTKPKVQASAHLTDQAADDRSALQRKRSNLAIGAPLTAAFIGGALVFEGLAQAQELEQDEEDAGVASTETSTSLSAGASENGSAAQVQQVKAEPFQQAEDDVSAAEGPAAPASESGEAPAVQASGQAATPSIEASGASEGIDTGDSASGEGGGAINFFSINVEGGSTEDTAVDPYVDQTVLGRNVIVGTSGDDVIEGTAGDDKILGLAGDDVIHGNAGNDLLYGNEGDDKINGGTGIDQLFGGSGDDYLEGGDDDELDLLNGGLGDDILVVNGQHDLALEHEIDGGDDLQIVRDGYAQEKGTVAEGTTFVFADNIDAGNPLPEGAALDTQSMDPGIENLAFEGIVDYDAFADDFNNRLTGNDGNNLLYAGGGDDIVAGGAGDDRLIGGEGRDDLSGGAGNDILDGGEDDDVLHGGAGDDILIGGLGEDELYGEAGNDSYHLGLNDIAIDSVFDHEGANRLVLEGVDGETIEASILGNDLYVTADQTPIAKFSDYVGNETSLAGIEFGQGLKTVESLLVDNSGLNAAIAEVAAKQAEAIANDPRFAHDDLTDPTVIGSNEGEALIGTSGDDWLSALDGGDHLHGNDGDDILEGGDDRDHLKGGAGDDRYLFKASDKGSSDLIYDTEGQNLAELQGFGRSTPEAALIGNDLRISVNDDLLFTVKNYVGHEDAFVGIQAGQRFFETDDLLA